MAHLRNSEHTLIKYIHRMRTLFALLFFAVLLQPGHSQNHDHVWLTGYGSFTGNPNFGGSVIDFNEDPPQVYYEDRELNIDATMASFCDSLGNLLLYTNGIALADSAHSIILGGENLNIGVYAVLNAGSGYGDIHSEMFLLQPGNPDTLLLLHGSLGDHNVFGIANTDFLQTKVSLGTGGSGFSVVSKNESLLTEVALGGLAAVKHANGRDWWVFFAVMSKNNYYRFLLTPEGIGNAELIEMEPAFPSFVGGGLIAFSPDGSKMARYEAVHGLYTYDFDRCDGSLSNMASLLLPNTSLGAGLAFSQNSRFLYIASALEIFQFDIWSDDLGASLDTVAVYDGYQSPFASTFFLMQLGPDGRIYINSGSSENVMGVIQYPDKQGLDCQVRQHSLQLPTYNSATMPIFPNYRLGPLDGSPCDTLNIDNFPMAKFRYEQDTLDYLKVEFTDLSYYEPANWNWDFGDNTTSQDTSSVHVFPENGTYTVCLTVGNMNGEHTFCRSLELGTVSSVEAAAEVDISVFPNPCRDGVNVIFSEYFPKDVQIVLYDANGQRHKAQPLRAGWNMLRLEGLRPRIYFYEIRENGLLLKSGKLVKVE